MDPECKVKISGHRDAEDIEGEGRYHVKKGRHYVFFDRRTEDGQEKYTLKFDAESLEYKRQGLINSTVFLKTGQMTASAYRTPYGEFEIGFFTTFYELKEEEGKVSLTAEYDMTLNGEPHEPGKILIEVMTASS